MESYKKGLFSLSNQGDGVTGEAANFEDDISRVNINFKELEKTGATVAGQSGADITVFKLWVNRILGSLIEKSRRQEGIESNRIRKLDDKILEIKGELQKKKNRRDEIDKVEIPEKEEKIHFLNDEVEEIKSGNRDPEPVDKLGYYIAIGILSALTIYLVIFYTSVIYSAFIYDVQASILENAGQGTFVFPTIVNLQALPETFKYHGYIGITFLLVSTSMFIALGYLIHKFEETKKWGKAIALLTFTFLFDCFLAYEIVYKIYGAKYAGGLVEEPWQFNMVFSDIAFYIIISAGFAVYIIWGFVLNFIFEEREKMNPGTRAIQKVRAKIELLKSRIEKLKEQKKQLSSDIDDESYQIERKEKEKDKIIFDKREVSKYISEFASGWITFIKLSFKEDEVENMITNVQAEVKQFIHRIDDINPNEVIR